MEATALAAAQLSAGLGVGGASVASTVQTFEAAFQAAQQRISTGGGLADMKTLLSPLLALGEQSARLEAEVAPLSNSDYRPSDLMMVTMRSHEFLFRCELTANVANRASDGVQQLFRQQS